MYLIWNIPYLKDKKNRNAIVDALGVVQAKLGSHGFSDHVHG